jgi:adenylate kinase family enzyme
MLASSVRRVAPVAALLLLAISPAARAGTVRAGARPARPAKKVVVFVGLPGAGKSTAADRLAARFGVKKMATGDIIRNTIKRRGWSADEKTDRLVAEEFAARRPGELGRRAARNAARRKGDVVVVEGFRTVADIEAFRHRFPDAVIVSIEASPLRRFARMLKRGRAGEDNLRFLRDRDRSEINRGGSPATGLRAAMRRADLRIRPRGDDLASLDRSLDRVWRRVEAPEKQQQKQQKN